MNYSSAYFPEGTEDLNQAQEKKLDLIAEKIDLRPEDRLLDVGCGWGNALLYYAKNYGCQATGLTLAGNQAALIEEKAKEAGLDGQVSVVVEHFQEAAFPPGRFDKVIFIGSIIHIEDRAEAARLTASLLREAGRALISETYFPKESEEEASSASKFISQGIFGYSNLITPGQEIRFLEEAGFEVLNVENITDHYIKTLDIWIDRVKANKARIEKVVPGESKRLRTYLTLARRSLRRRTALQQQILVRKIPG